MATAIGRHRMHRMRPAMMGDALQCRAGATRPYAIDFIECIASWGDAAHHNHHHAGKLHVDTIRAYRYHEATRSSKRYTIARAQPLPAGSCARLRGGRAPATSRELLRRKTIAKGKSLSSSAQNDHSGKSSILCTLCALCGSILLLLAGCGSSPGLAGPPAPVFRTTTEGDGNAVRISASGDTAIVEVQSSSGIGAATIELVAGTPPAKLVVRLHLRGLETFRLAYDQTVIVAEVPSGDSRSVLQHIELPDGGTRPITPDSPLWLDTRIISAQAVPAIPLQQGYFELRLPNGLLSDQQRSFMLRWIDFYRG